MFQGTKERELPKFLSGAFQAYSQLWISEKKDCLLLRGVDLVWTPSCLPSPLGPQSCSTVPLLS